jgi:hypothetical protein
MSSHAPNPRRHAAGISRHPASMRPPTSSPSFCMALCLVGPQLTRCPPTGPGGLMTYNQEQPPRSSTPVSPPPSLDPRRLQGLRPSIPLQQLEQQETKLRQQREKSGPRPNPHPPRLPPPGCRAYPRSGNHSNHPPHPHSGNRGASNRSHSPNQLGGQLTNNQHRCQGTTASNPRS